MSNNNTDPSTPPIDLQQSFINFVAAAAADGSASRQQGSAQHQAQPPTTIVATAPAAIMAQPPPATASQQQAFLTTSHVFYPHHHALMNSHNGFWDLNGSFSQYFNAAAGATTATAAAINASFIPAMTIQQPPASMPLNTSPTALPEIPESVVDMPSALESLKQSIDELANAYTIAPSPIEDNRLVADALSKSRFTTKPAKLQLEQIMRCILAIQRLKQVLIQRGNLTVQPPPRPQPAPLPTRVLPLKPAATTMAARYRLYMDTPTSSIHAIR